MSGNSGPAVQYTSWNGGFSHNIASFCEIQDFCPIFEIQQMDLSSWTPFRALSRGIRCWSRPMNFAIGIYFFLLEIPTIFEDVWWRNQQLCLWGRGNGNHPENNLSSKLSISRRKCNKNAKYRNNGYNIRADLDFTCLNTELLYSKE